VRAYVADLYLTVWTYESKNGQTCNTWLYSRIHFKACRLVKQFWSWINKYKIKELTSPSLQIDTCTKHLMSVHFPTCERLLAIKCHFSPPSDYHCMSEEVVSLLTRAHPVVHSMWGLMGLQYLQTLAPKPQATSDEYQALNQNLLKNPQ